MILRKKSIKIFTCVNKLIEQGIIETNTNTGQGNEDSPPNSLHVELFNKAKICDGMK